MSKDRLEVLLLRESFREDEELGTSALSLAFGKNCHLTHFHGGMVDRLQKQDRHESEFIEPTQMQAGRIVGKVIGGHCPLLPNSWLYPLVTETERATRKTESSLN